MPSVSYIVGHLAITLPARIGHDLGPAVDILVHSFVIKLEPLGKLLNEDCDCTGAELIENSFLTA